MLLAPVAAAAIPARNADDRTLRLHECAFEDTDMFDWIIDYPKRGRELVRLLDGRPFTCSVGYFCLHISGVESLDVTEIDGFEELSPRSPWAEKYYIFCDLLPHQISRKFITQLVVAIPDEIPIELELFNQENGEPVLTRVCVVGVWGSSTREPAGA